MLSVLKNEDSLAISHNIYLYIAHSFQKDEKEAACH